VTASAAHALTPFVDAIEHDPVFAYSLLAAALLAVVSLATSLLRRDLAVLLRPRLLLRVVAAVLLAFGLWLAGTLLQRSLGTVPIVEVVGGLARFPLYLTALAYGPGVGLVAGALFAGLQAGGGAAGWDAVLVTLELVVLGWLAIYPSPRRGRWAGPFDAVLAYALAWGTGGLALLDSRHGTVTPSALWAQHQHVVLGVAVTVVLLVLVSPGAYDRLFPGSRIAPPEPGAPAPADAAEHERARDGRRDPMTLTHPELPRALERGRHQRELEPFPNRLSDDGDAD